MSQSPSPPSPFSPTRPSRLILHEFSLDEAQTKLRLSPKRLRLYASDTTHDAQQSDHHTTNDYRGSRDMDVDKLQELLVRDQHGGMPLGFPIGKCLYSQNERQSPRTTSLPVSNPTSHQPSEFELRQEKSNHVAPEGDLKRRRLNGNGSRYGSHSLDSVPKTWKPPKPRKPSFLSVTASESTAFDTAENNAENAHHGTYTGFEKNQQYARLPLSNVRFSPSSKPHERSHIRLNISHAVGNKKSSSTNEQQGKTRRPARKVIWRPSLRPAPYRSPETTCKLPIDDPERPFPFPIPTMDKLPLRMESTMDQSMYGKEQNPNVKHIKNILSRLKKIALIWDKVKGLALVTVSLHEFVQPVQSSYAFRVGVRWSIISLNTPNSHDNERQLVSIVPTEDAVSLLQVKLIVPVLLLRAISLIAAAAQGPKSPKALSTIGRFAKALASFVIIPILWLLKEFRY